VLLRIARERSGDRGEAAECRSTFAKERVMATREQGNATQADGPDKKSADETSPDEAGTFETDISETGEDGTTVRQAEVNEDDLKEVKPAPDDGAQTDAGQDTNRSNG
jgi:hypothetical protein